MGIAIKSSLIAIDLFLFLCMLLLEAVFIISFLVLPLATIFVLFL